MLRTALLASAIALLLSPQAGAQLAGPRLAPLFPSVVDAEAARGPHSVTFLTLQEPEGGRHRGRSVLAYTGMGLLVGAVTGALVGPLLTTPGCLAWNKDAENQGSCLDGLWRPEPRIRAALVFGGVGAVVGAIVGLLAP